MPHEFRLVAKTLFGLEGVLADELRALGAEEVQPFNRLVTFKGDLRLLYRANLCCRTAIRILKRIRKFNAADEKALYAEVRKTDWSRYLDETGSLAIDPVVTRSTFANSLYVAQLAKDAIVDQFRERTGARPSVRLENPDLRLNLHMNENIVSLYLDSSGDSLHRRGYRTETGLAPMNEVLAAGIIQLSGWDHASPFADGMCGSGTFVIEAALMARKIPPGAFRKEFGFERWKDYDPALYREVFQEATAEEQEKLPFEIAGSDRDAQAVRVAARNVRNAGLENDVRIECRPFEEQTPPRGPSARLRASRGTLILNPPYGERIAVEQINTLYRSIGDTLKKKYAGWTVCVVSGNPEALDSLGLRPSKVTKLFNGPIECRLFEFQVQPPKQHRSRQGA
jgi:putative N6-adenine-specific DNA methylase